MKSGFRLIGGSIIALAALTQYTSAQAPPIIARTIEDRDHVTVMELTGGYDRQPEGSRAYEENIRKAIARELLRQHQDDYDFIVAFTGFPYNLGSDEEGTRVGGRYYAIKNDVQGIGQAQFDHSADWGSTGRLQGYIDMGALSTLVTDPTDPLFERTLSTLSHEVAHRWSAHLRFQNADGTPNSSLLGAQGAHWSFFLQSHNSVLYGNDWRDNGNGTFTSVGRSRSYYSPLDLYAMGVIGRSEVPPFFLIENAEGDPSRLPEVGATVSGPARTLTIDDVIAAEGERVPEAGSSPRQFKIAFVLLVRPGESADGAQLRAINNIREAFATRMVILTGGRALVEIFPDATEPGVTDPDRILPPSSGPRTAAVDLAQGINWLLSRQGANGRFADSPATAVRDTATAVDLLAGQPAAFASRQAALGWLSALQDVSNVDTVSRRVAAIAPQFSPADNTFLLAARHASGGWGLRAGDETDPFDTALALAAIQGGDPSTAIASLITTQLPDGSWPMNLGGPGSILATSTVLRLAGRFASAPFNEALTQGGTWLETRQNSDGGFGESGSTVYETALAIVHASRVASTTVDVRWAVEYLRRGQLADGSWNESVYETALAVLALQLGDLPNVALVASSLAFAPADPVEGETVTLTAMLANSGATDLTNVAVRFYDGHPASGGLPIGEEAIIASLPAQAQVPIAVIWNTTDAAGNHDIVAIADPSLTLNESNEADNLLTGPLAVRPPPEGPDIAVAHADLVFTPDSLRSVPQTQAFDARIANLGRTAASNVQVVLFAGDPAAGGARIADTVVDVPARGSAQVTFNVTITTPGERRYFIVADPDNTLNEADDANNVASRTLAVSGATDLFVTSGSITLSENPVALGRDLQIGAQVGNSGTADVFAARVRVFIDAPGGAIEVATLTHDLPAGQTTTIAAIWRTSRTLADAPVIVHVDPLNAFSETSETNNQAAAALSVPSSTDANLRVTHQELVVATPLLQGGSTAIQIPVHNTGFADAANVGVAFYLGVPGSGGVQIGATQTIDLIPAGGQANASVAWDQITTFGDKLIYAVVDPAGTVTEFDEQDNAAFITGDVLSLPDLAVSSASLSFSPAFPRNGEPVIISALVSNLGEQTAGNVSVQLFLGAPAAGGLPIGPAQTVTVEGGAFASVQAQVDALSLGASTIFVVVDAANQVPELNEANNTASRTIGVQDGSFFFTNAYFSPNGDDVQDSTELFFRLIESSASAVHAIDRHGRVAREFALESSTPSGSVTWDGRDTLGRIVPDGSYSFALIDGAGNRLASASVVVDNNNLPVGEAVGTRYLLQTRLTTDATAPSAPVFHQPYLDHGPAGWLADDSGMLTIVRTQLFCAHSFGNFFQWCTNYQFLTDRQTGVYVTTPDGRSRTRITPDSWTTQSFVGTPPNQDTYGTQVIGAYPSNDGSKVFVGTRQYRYYGSGSSSNFEYRTGIELWVANTDGSGTVRVGTVNGDRLIDQSMFPGVWSPDDTRIAVPSFTWWGNGYSYHLDVLNADGTGVPVRIDNTEVGDVIYGVAWNPSGERLIYQESINRFSSSAWHSVRPDGSGRVEIATPDDTYWGGGGSRGIEGPVGKWLDNDRFANLLSQGGNGGLRVWVMSITGAPPRVVTPEEMLLREASVGPRGIVAYSDYVNQFQPFPEQQSTGIWQVDADGNIEQIYSASTHNQGIFKLTWSDDGRRLAFVESVITDFRMCQHSEGESFCGDSIDALGFVDVRERTARVFPSGFESFSVYPLGFFPDGNSLLMQDFTTGTPRLIAVSAEDGETSVLVDDPQATYGCCMGNSVNQRLDFTPSGKYYLYGTNGNNVGSHVWSLGSLLNLTTELSFQRRGSLLEIRGTAEDRHFQSYVLEAAPADAPNQWVAIAPPSDTSVINGLLAEWIPPSDGTFLVRLTATDLAGNRSTTRRRITWGLAPSITNVIVAPRQFSPNGDGTADQVALDYLVLGPVNLEFSVFDSTNRLVRTISRSHATLGPASIAWNGRNEADQIVADGVYRIHVLDFDFFVTIDRAPPDVRLSIGSGYRVVPEKLVCQAVGASNQCTRFDGPVVDTPRHDLTGRAADVALASWTLDVGTGATPAEWVRLDQGSDLLVARNASSQPLSPAADTAIRALTDPRDVAAKRYRLTATDQAGNTSVVVSELAQQDVIVHLWDGVPAPTMATIEQSLGSHRLAASLTVHASIQSVRVQTRLEGSGVWVDGTIMSQPPLSLDFIWDNRALIGGRTYEVRLVARDVNGVEVTSNVLSIHSDLFEFTSVEPSGDRTTTHGLASLREEVSDIRLVLAAAGDPDLGLTSAQFTDPTAFSIVVAPDPALESCESAMVPARFKGVGSSGRIYYSNVRTVTRRGVPTRECTKTGVGPSAQLELTATRLTAAQCGLPNPQRVLINLRGIGAIASGTLRLSIQDVPNGLLRQVPVGSNPFVMEIDTQDHAEGAYLVAAEAVLDGSNPERRVFANAGFVVDRTSPEAQITYPSANTLVCPSRVDPLSSIVAIEGVAEDANFDHYELAYGQGDDPAAWIPIPPVSFAASRAPRRGVLANWNVAVLPGGTYTLCLKVFDQGGNAECRVTTFTLQGGTSIRDVGAEPLFSPNGDGNRDSTAITFTLDAPALVTARVFAVTDGVRGSTPVRTVMSSAQHLPGSNTLFWDGLTDLGSAAVDGVYHVVITANDACGNPVSAFAVVAIDATAPSALISAPSPGSVDRVLVEIRGSVSDLHFTQYQLEVGEGDAPQTWTPIATGRAPIQDGRLGQWNNQGQAGVFTLRLVASDTAGSSREIRVPIVVTATQPLIDSVSATPLIFSPNGDGRVDTTTISYSTTTSTRVTIDVLVGEVVTATLLSDTALPAGPQSMPWSGLDTSGAAFADGEYRVRISATSATDAGRVQSEEIAVTIDATAPNAVLAAPIEGVFVRGDVVVIGTVADANIDTYVVRYGTAAMGATVLLDEGAQSRASHALGTLSGLATGSYTIRVVVSDLAQNITTLDRSFVIDDVSPAVTLTAPETGAMVGAVQPAVDVHGSVAEANLQQWLLRYGAGLEPTAWTTLITRDTPPASDQLAAFDTTGLADGIYTISLIAVDRAGTQSEDRVQATIDRTAPAAVIRQPADGARLATPQPIRGDAADAHFATATLEISEGPAATAFQFAPLQVIDVAVNNGTLFDLTTLPADGVYTLRLTVEDLAGQRTETRSTIVIDTEPPSPAGNLVATLENRRDARLHWEASADSALTGYHLYRNGQRLTPAPIAATAFVDAGLNDGTHRYAVTVVDVSGLESVASNEAGVTVDLTAPAARIQLPANNSVVGDLVDIRGTAASAVDFFEFRVSVADGANPQPNAFALIRRSPAPVTSGLLAQIDTAGVPAGSVVTIKLEAQDLEGNVAEDRITITIDNQTPATPVLLTAAPEASTVTASWQGVGDADLAGYLLYNNHLLANARRIVTGSLTPYLIQGTTYVDAGLVDGDHSYYVVAVDRAGNMGAPSNAIAATVETRAPRATIVQPATGARTDSPILLVAESTDSDLAGIQFQFKAVADAIWIDLNAPIATVPFTTTWDPRTVATGTYQFRAVATDSHANIDAAPPFISIVHADVTPPSPATAPVAQVNEGRVSLTWTASPSADLAGYIVNRRLGTGAPTAVSGVLTTTTFDDIDVADGQYSYFVVARDTSGNLSDGSSEANARVHTLFLTTPSVCLAEPALSVFGVGATPGAGVTLFVDDGPGPVAIASTQAAADGSFQFDGASIVSGANVLTAQSEDAFGNRSKRSPPLQVTFSAAPAGVTGLTTQVNGRDVTLTWLAAANASSYTVQRIDTQSTTETTLTEFEVPDGRHTYTVTALNACLVASQPAQVEVEVGDVAAPAAPANLQATANSAEVSLQWTASVDSDVAGYHVYRRSGETGWTRITSSPLATTTHIDVRRPNGTHVYRVTALDHAGNESVPSNEASAAAVDTTAPEPPVLTTPTDAAHPQTMAAQTTPAGGTAEPGAAVTLLRNGVALGRTTARAEIAIADFELDSEPQSAVAFDPATGKLAWSVQEHGGEYAPGIAVADLRTRQTRYYPQNWLTADPIFTDSGTRIAYAWYIYGLYMISVRDLASDTVVRQTYVYGEPQALIAAPDGSRFAVNAYDSATGQRQFQLLDFVDGNTTTITNEPDGVYEGVFSADGHWLAYTNGGNLLRLIELETGDIRDVGQAESGSAVFSPDGSRIAFEACGDTSCDIALYDIQSGQITPLPAEASPTVERRSPSFSSDGRSLAYFVDLPDDVPTRTRVRNLVTGEVIEIEREEDDLHWSADGSLIIVDNGDITQVAMPGQFTFQSIALETGTNLISAIATDDAGNTSQPALPISLTFDTGDSADLVIHEQDLFVYPLISAPGESVRISATVRNAGHVPATGVSVAFFDIDDQGLTTQIGSAQSVGAVVVGGQASASVQWIAVAGRRRVRARVDPFAAIPETSESNNSADRTIDVVAPGAPTVRLSLDRTSYQPDDTVRIAASAINPATAANFVLQVTIEDELGNVAATVLDQALNGFSYSTHEATPSWPTDGVLAGAYRARVTLRRADGFSVTATAPFSVAAAENIAAALSTDRSTYTVGDTAQLTGIVRNLSANVVVENLAASIRVRDAAGTDSFNGETPIGTLLLGGQTQVPATWRTLVPGSYTSTITVRKGAQQVAEASRTFTVNGIVTLKGTLAPTSSRIGLGQTAEIAAAVVNEGSMAADGLTLRLRLVGSGSQATVRTFTRHVDLAAAGDVAWPLVLDTTGLTLGTYTFFLEAERSGITEPLATATLTMLDVVAPGVQILGPAPDLVTDGDFTLVARVTDDASAVVRVESRLDSGAWQQMAIADPAAGTYSHKLVVAPLADGPHAIEIRAIDAAGNDDRTSSSDPNPASRSFTVERAAQNQAPAASAGATQSVQEGSVVTLDGSASADADGDPLTYQWTQLSGPVIALDLTDPVRPSFLAPQVSPDGATLVFQLIVNDGTTNSAPAPVNTVVTNINRAPETSDVSLSVDEDGAVAFTLVVTDPDLDPLTFEIGAASHGTVAGVAPALIYTPALNYHGGDAFEIAVRDSGGLAATAHVSVTIVAVNDPPLAVVGADQTATEGELVTLDGSASHDIDGDALSYRWTQTDGPVVALDFTDPARPGFGAPEVPRTGSTLMFQLIVNDGGADSAPVLTGVVVSNINRAPSATDRDVSADEDTAVTFTLDAVDPDDDVLVFDVQPPAHGAISGAGPELTYTPAPDFHGLDQFTVVVRDTAGLSATALIQIGVASVNDRPVANAGTNRTVEEGEAVILDGTASTDVDGDVLSYTWTQIAGPAVTLEGADSTHAHFTAPEVPVGGATLTFGLAVSDGAIQSTMSQVNVTISNVNHPPVAEAGPPQHVGWGATVTLDGTLSYDPDNDALTYAWQQVGGVPVILGNAQTAAPSFVADSVGASSVLTFELTVSDGVASATDPVEITVDSQNHGPIANAGPDQDARPGDAVTLSGAASSDPDGDALTYRWTQVAGVPVVLTGALTANPSFAAPPVPLSGDTLSFDLIVSDGVTESAADRIDVRVLGGVTGPMCAAAMVSPSVLWPPNHHLVNIAITNYGTSSNRLKLRILSVTQDEPTSGTGDGDTSPDTNFQGNVVLLRAERSGSGNGRVYHVRFSVVEDASRKCEGVVTVNVPHDPNTPAVDDGQKFDSTTKEPKKK